MKLQDVVKLSSKRAADPLAAGIERFVGLEHIQSNSIRIQDCENVSD